MGLGVGMGMGSALSRNLDTGPAPAPAPSPVPATATTPVERLKHLKELFDLGLVEKEEFDEKKKEILAGL
jgi:hypothetical protein